jgi:periplasmic protein TonB
VDLNYGVDLIGSGDIQTLNKANDSKNNYDVKPSDDANSSNQNPKPQPVSQPKEIVKNTPAKQSEVITSDEDSKVVVKKTSDSPKTSKTPVVSQPSTKPVVASPKPSPPVPERQVDKGSIFKKSGSSSNSNGTVGTKDGIGGNNNGDGKKGEVGDKGDPKGTLDGKSMYGKPGNGGTKGGAAVNISGWNKKNISLPKDNSDETGRIIFKVTVNNFGDVTNVSVAETNVSPSVTNFYRSYIQNKLSSYLTPQGTPPDKSTGTITINITRGN